MSPISLRPRQNPTASQAGRLRGVSALPLALLKESGRRLGWAGFLYSGLWATFFLLAAVFRIQPPLRDFLTGIPAILLGLSIGWLARSGRLTPVALLEIGLVFEVLGAIPIAVSETWSKFGTGSVTSLAQTGLSLLEQLRLLRPEALQIGSMPWVCIWILLFPTLVPTPPRRALIASLLAASTVPLALLTSFAINGVAEPLRDQAGMLLLGQAFFPFLCAGLATLGARVVYQLGVDVKQAQELGSYRLIRKLGQGGMGEVWEAHHRLLARPAAVKLIRREAFEGSLSAGGHNTLLQRFQREAQATASLASPNAVDLYDFGVTEDGTFYYVMELLDGLDLQTMVQRYGPQPPERVVHYLRQACHALSEAHEKGLIHRDVKPANLYACRMGRDTDVLKVLDFGLVKSIRSPGERIASPTSALPASASSSSGPIDSGDAELTAIGLLTGTPSYLSPEMARGSDQIGPPADIYALGCVAFWLLTGRTVFQGDVMTQVHGHAALRPSPPSRFSLAPIPEDLENLILRCLQKDPENRPPTTEALAAELSACQLDGQWTQELARQWWASRNPQLISAAPAAQPSASEATMSMRAATAPSMARTLLPSTPVASDPSNARPSMPESLSASQTAVAIPTPPPPASDSPKPALWMLQPHPEDSSPQLNTLPYGFDNPNPVSPTPQPSSDQPKPGASTSEPASLSSQSASEDSSPELNTLPYGFDNPPRPNSS